MKLDISYIPTENVPAVLPQMRKYLEMAAQRTGGRATVADLVDMVLSGNQQLWVVYDVDTKDIYGMLTSEVRKYPQFRMLSIQDCAIEPHYMQFVADRMQECAKAFAQANGCVGIELMGRPGWGKMLKQYGYDTQAVICHKFFGS